VSATENITRATVGLTFQAKNGFFAGAGVSWNVPTLGRDARFTDTTDQIGDYYDWQFRIGYHPGVKVYVPPPPPPPPPPPQAPPPPPVHNLSVKAACDPCSVEVGKTSTVTATVQDSISCSVTYRWTAPRRWRNGRTVHDLDGVTTGRQRAGDHRHMPDGQQDGVDTVNIQVTSACAPTRSKTVLASTATRCGRKPRVLDEAIAAMRENTTLRLEIEGHTCNIGTAEYNLALGDRRANSVKDYLVSRGVTADRLRTVSYGEERPKYDNSREETRRLNRRAALVVNLR
jgi:hypothetical protein